MKELIHVLLIRAKVRSQRETKQALDKETNQQGV